MDTTEQTSETALDTQALVPGEGTTALVHPTADTDVSELNDLESIEEFIRLETQAASVEPEPVEAQEEELPAQPVTTEPEDHDAKNWRLQAIDDFDKKVFSLHKASKGELTVLEITEMLQKKAKATEPGESAATEPAPASSKLAELNARKAEIEQELRTANEEMDFTRVSDLQISLNDLNFERVLATQSEAEAQRAEHAASLQKQTDLFHASLKRAATDYPDSVVEGTALFNEMAAIDAALEAQGNPLFNEPDKAHKIAMMAANNLGIAPARASATKAAPVQARQTVKPRPLAGGTSTQGVSAPPPAEWDKINTPEQLEAYLASQ